MFHVKPLRGIPPQAEPEDLFSQQNAPINENGLVGSQAEIARRIGSPKRMIYINFFVNIDSFLSPETVNMAGHNFWIEHGAGQRIRFQ